MTTLEDVSTHCACFHLRHAARTVTRSYESWLKPTGLKATQFSLLVAANTLGPISITDLADLMGMERTTLTRNLRPMMADGLLDLSEEGYKRKKDINVTARGRKKLKSALPLWRKAQREVQQKLGAKHFDVLRNLLRNVSDMDQRGADYTAKLTGKQYL